MKINVIHSPQFGSYISFEEAKRRRCPFFGIYESEDGKYLFWSLTKLPTLICCRLNSMGWNASSYAIADSFEDAVINLKMYPMTFDEFNQEINKRENACLSKQT